MATDLEIRWKAADGIRFRASDDRLLVEAPPRPSAQVPIGDAAVAAALARLSQGATLAQLVESVREAGGDAARLEQNLGLMRGAGLLIAELTADQACLARLIPYGRAFDVPAPRQPTSSLRLNRFSLLRPSAEGWMLENPQAHCGALLMHPLLWQRLSQGGAQSIGGGSDPIDAAFDLLAQLGFLEHAARLEPPAERVWEFHDRWFEHRSRQNDDFLPLGSTYRFANAFASPPAIRPAYPAIEIPLPRPALRTGQGLFEVIERRRSRRAMATTPVTVPEIGELLWRAVRTIETLPGQPQETLRRPFPSGGGIHELEFYLVAGHCEGLEAGLYHYTHGHALAQLAAPSRPAQAMLQGCGGAWGQPDRPPQAMIVIASRLPRLAWKYQGIAYRLSLLNAGVALQNLSLVCEELGLAGTIAGSGDPRLFAAATGNSSWEETSIAEFGFGRAAAIPSP